MKTEKRVFDVFNDDAREALRVRAKYCLAFIDAKQETPQTQEFFNSVFCGRDLYGHMEYWLPNGIRTPDIMESMQEWSKIPKEK
jgi:hypothetical protein